MEIKTRIENLDINGIARRDPKAIAELREVYQSAFNESIKSGCGNCIRKAYGRLHLLTQNQIITMKTQKYQLKKGIVIEHPAYSGKHYSADNITDDVAEKILKKNKDLEKHFIIKADSEEKATETKKEPKVASKNEVPSAVKEAKTGIKQSDPETKPVVSETKKGEPAAPIETAPKK